MGLEEIAVLFVCFGMSAAMMLIPVVVVAFGMKRQSVWRSFASERGLSFHPGFPVVGSPVIKGVYEGVEIRIRVQRNWGKRFLHGRRTRRSRFINQTFALTYYEANLGEIMPRDMWCFKKQMIVSALCKTLTIGIAAVDERVSVGGVAVNVAREFFERPGVQAGLLKIMEADRSASCNEGFLSIYHPMIASWESTLTKNLELIVMTAQTMGGEGDRPNTAATDDAQRMSEPDGVAW